MRSVSRTYGRDGHGLRRLSEDKGPVGLWRKNEKVQEKETEQGWDRTEFYHGISSVYEEGLSNIPVSTEQFAGN